MLSKLISGAMLVLLLAAVFSWTPVFAEELPKMAVANVGNVDYPDKWTAGPPRWVGSNLFSFYDNETHVNDTFYVGLQIYGAIDLFAWQFTLAFNTTLLKCTGAWIPEHHIFEGHLIVLPNPYINIEAGYVKYGSTLMDGDPGVSGNGTLGQVGFQIMQAPRTNEDLVCDLGFAGVHNVSDTFIILASIKAAEVQNIDGRYEYHDPGIFGDVNGDGRVDITDVAITSVAFGSYPGRPKWNVACDVNRDQRIDIQDLARVSAAFGKSSLP